MRESKFIQTPSGRFHAMVAGAGEPVILVHGSSVEFNSWRTWERNIDALAENFRVYSLDLLGYGESDKVSAHRDTLAEALALRQLLDAEHLPRTHFIGLSWGGQIVQNIALDAPERVNKLVLVDSAFDSSAEGLQRLGQMTAPTLIVWDQDDAVIPVRFAPILAEAIPHSQLEIFTSAQRDPDANPENKHWSQETHSTLFNQVVTKFLLGETRK
jgi:pimeloyl-ACP methyl ester carboxylesterase